MGIIKILVAFGALYILYRGLNLIVNNFKRATDERATGGKLVACKQCGVHVPTNEANSDSDEFLCENCKQSSS